MKTKFTKKTAYELLKKYNKEHFHLQHGRTVALVMRYFAEKEGFGDEADFWEIVGLLHDIDFEQYPQQHCIKGKELLEAAGAEPELVHAMQSHGWQICTDVQPQHQMEKILYATDELTGLIGAAALMRPSKSVQDMELKSIKKKFKDKHFAAGCSRDVFKRGAELLGWSLDELLTQTLSAMKAVEDKIPNEDF